MAAWHAAKFCCEHGYGRAIFEGDSLTVVSALKKTKSCMSSYGQVIDDTKTLVMGLQFYEFSHIRRKANKAAHHLAKAALLYSLDKVWIEECLSHIQSIVLDDWFFITMKSDNFFPLKKKKKLVKSLKGERML